ncbi:anti-sigma factor [Rosettibacter firmus]|uniref:anti-sigma factor n=1 Tax=Rosettibacter firmus TaxID=3111522 RepID=UPI00336C30A0
MSDTAVHEMIAAFAIGCMDKENFIQFKDYVDNGGELPEGALGELQNIVSLIPTILEIETPKESLKDEVAKKLISLQDEIKTRIREERRKTLMGKTFNNYAEKPQKPTFQLSNLTKSTIVKEEEKEKEKQAKINGSVIPEKPLQYITPQQTLPHVKEKSGSIIGWIALLITIVLFSILSYYSFTSIESLNRQIEELNHDITLFRGELSRTNNFINNYLSFIEFFNYKDVIIVNLNSVDPNDKAMARVFLSFDVREGLIQFKNVKPLPPNQAYQLWAVSKGISYSMGVYNPGSNEYIHINSFPFIPKENIEFLKVTIESSTGSPTPSAQNYLIGNFPQTGKSK